MKVHVKIGRRWKQFAAEREQALDLEPGSTVADLISLLNIPEKEIGLIIRNKERVHRSTLLAHDDVLELHSFASGG